jgi:hypothetical protein
MGAQTSRCNCWCDTLYVSLRIDESMSADRYVTDHVRTVLVSSTSGLSILCASVWLWSRWHYQVAAQTASVVKVEQPTEKNPLSGEV